MNTKTYLFATGVVFSIHALLHIARLLFDLPLYMGVTGVPTTFSLLTAAISIFFAYYAFEISGRV